MIHKDVTIIGAGPVGLFCIFQCGMFGLKSIVVDSLEFIGGQCTALYPEKPIYDIPGYKRILANDLIKNLSEQASVFEPKYLLNNTVTSLSNEDGKWLIKTSQNNEIISKVVIIAAGGGAFGPNKPPLKNIENYENTSVFYLINDKELLRDKKVVIAGGGDSAVDWAILLADVAAKIYIVHRRDKFRALPDSVVKLHEIAKTGKIELVVPYQLSNLQGDGKYLSYVEVEDLDSNKKLIECDILLPMFGLSMDLGPIAAWGLNVDKKHIIVNPATMETNHKGIFAIGDIATYAGKLKLILCGFSEAAIACNNAYSIIYPDKPLHFEYSTTKGLPKNKD